MVRTAVRLHRIDAEVRFGEPVPTYIQERARYEVSRWASPARSRPSLRWVEPTRALVSNYVLAADSRSLAVGLAKDVIQERLLNSTSMPIVSVSILGPDVSSLE